MFDKIHHGSSVARSLSLAALSILPRPMRAQARCRPNAATSSSSLRPAEAIRVTLPCRKCSMPTAPSTIRRTAPPASACTSASRPTGRRSISRAAVRHCRMATRSVPTRCSRSAALPIAFTAVLIPPPPASITRKRVLFSINQHELPTPPAKVELFPRNIHKLIPHAVDRTCTDQSRVGAETLHLRYCVARQSSIVGTH